MSDRIRVSVSFQPDEYLKLKTAAIYAGHSNVTTFVKRCYELGLPELIKAVETQKEVNRIIKDIKLADLQQFLKPKARSNKKPVNKNKREAAMAISLAQAKKAKIGRA